MTSAICEFCEEPFERAPRSRRLYCSHRCQLEKRTSRRTLARLRMTPAEHEAVRLYNRDKQRRYRIEKPDLARVRAKRYRARHHEQTLRKKREWAVANPDKWRATKRVYEDRRRQDPAWVEARRIYHREYTRRRRRPCDLPAEQCASAGTVHKHCRKCGWPIQIRESLCSMCRTEKAAGWNMSEREEREVQPETIQRREYHRQYRKRRLGESRLNQEVAA